jgi:hypothetical protein
MHYGRNRDHLLSRKVHRSQIDCQLACYGEDPELCWYDDDYQDELEQSLLAEHEADKQQELEAMREADEWDEYDPNFDDYDPYFDGPYDPYDPYYEGDPIPPKPDNLTRKNSEWGF